MKKIEAVEALEELEKMIDDIIVDASEVKGAEGMRQRYCYYREKVWVALKYLNRK